MTSFKQSIGWGVIAIVAGVSLPRASVADEAVSDRIADRLSFFRFAEDYSDLTAADRERDALARIKKIPLGREDIYLTLGADYRLRYETNSSALFGLVPNADFDQVLNRMMAHADLHVGSAFRGFVQVSGFAEDGRPGGPGPFDLSDPDIQQAFVDIGAKGTQIRIGRHELVLGSGKLTDIREGPNQRQSFDGVRLMLDLAGPGSIDAFAVADVLPSAEAFRDSSEDGTRFWGLYGTKIAEPWAGAGLDLYYFGIDRKDAIYDVGVADERRHSFGSRLTGARGSFAYEYEAIYQTGSFADLDINAWGVRTEHYFTFGDWMGSPKVGLIANATSGDRDGTDGSLGTFDALFPNPAYTTDASIFRPRNLYELHPVVSFNIAQNVNVLLEANVLWRVETGDAVYAVPGFSLVSGAASDERYIGTVFDAIVTWTPSPIVTVQGSYVHATAGDAIKDVGGEDIDFVLLQTMLKF